MGWGGGGVDNVCLDIHLHDDLFLLIASTVPCNTDSLRLIDVVGLGWWGGGVGWVGGVLITSLWIFIYVMISFCKSLPQYHVTQMLCILHSFTHSLTHSVTHSLIHSFIHSYIQQEHSYIQRRRRLASGYGGLQSISDGLHSSSDGLQPTSDDARSKAIAFLRFEAIVFLRSEATAPPSPPDGGAVASERRKTIASEQAVG